MRPVFSTSFEHFPVDLNMLSELSELRDRINNEIHEWDQGESVAVIETDDFIITVKGIEEADSGQVDEYYKKYNSGYRTNSGNTYLLLTMVFENKVSVKPETSL